MKILVTGATGFIGQNIIPQMLEKGHSVIAVSRNEEKARSFEWYERVRFIAADIYQPISDTFRYFGKPEVTVHLAWSGLPNYTELFHFEENLPADFRFLKALLAGGLKHLLITGTCFEYGLRNGCFSEDDLSQPANPYSLAKDTLRKFLEQLRKQYFFTLQWARLFYMFGPGQNPTSLISQLNLAIANRDQIFNMSGGEQLRDYLPVEEVARRLITLIQNPQYSGIINICNGEPISVRQFVEQHIAKHGITMELNLGYYPYSTFEPMALWGTSKFFNRKGELT